MLGFLGKIIAPTNFILANPDQLVRFRAKTNQPANLSFINTANAEVLIEQNNTSILEYDFSTSQGGDFWIKFSAFNGLETIYDSQFGCYSECP
jgi:hypothetical protein